MTSTALGIVLGILVGLRHAFEPDHLTAVSTLVTETHSPRQGALLGIAWGLGHTISLVVVGVILTIIGATLPERAGVIFELGVAAMLLVLGARAIVVARRSYAAQTIEHTHDHVHDDEHAHTHDSGWQASGHVRLHTHDHVHDDEHAHTHDHGHDEHAHEHVHRDDGQVHLRDDGPVGHTHAVNAGRRASGHVHPHSHEVRGRRRLRSLVVGLVHGLAGSGALTALVFAQLPGTTARIVYMTLFGLGSIVGMALASGLAGATLGLVARSTRVRMQIGVATGLVSIMVGLLWGIPLLMQR